MSRSAEDYHQAAALTRGALKRIAESSRYRTVGYCGRTDDGGVSYSLPGALLEEAGTLHSDSAWVGHGLTASVTLLGSVSIAYGAITEACQALFPTKAAMQGVGAELPEQHHGGVLTHEEALAVGERAAGDLDQFAALALERKEGPTLAKVDRLTGGPRQRTLQR